MQKNFFLFKEVFRFLVSSTSIKECFTKRINGEKLLIIFVKSSVTDFLLCFIPILSLLIPIFKNLGLETNLKQAVKSVAILKLF